MRKQVSWASAALAVAIVASLSSSAGACHPLACAWYFPGGNAYYGCAASYQACVVGYGACGPVGCNPYLGCAGYNCGYRPYGYGCYGCIARKIHNHCAIHRARKYGLYGGGYCGGGWGDCFGGCGGSCGGDCVTGGCGAGGCNSGDCVTSGNYVTPRSVDLPSDANIISDRTIGDDDAPPAAVDDQSAAINRSVFRLTGLKQEDTAAGVPAFERGLTAYRGGSMNDALTAFTMASEAEPSNAVYHYYRALAMFDVAGADAAQDVLAEAVDVEKREGVKNWGKRMERVQGRSRLWVEMARRDAGLVR